MDDRKDLHRPRRRRRRRRWGRERAQRELDPSFRALPIPSPRPRPDVHRDIPFLIALRRLLLIVTPIDVRIDPRLAVPARLPPRRRRGDESRPRRFPRRIARERVGRAGEGRDAVPADESRGGVDRRGIWCLGEVAEAGEEEGRVGRVVRRGGGVGVGGVGWARGTVGHLPG